MHSLLLCDKISLIEQKIPLIRIQGRKGTVFIQHLQVSPFGLNFTKYYKYIHRYYKARGTTSHHNIR